MNSKKIILAAGICLAASILTFFKNDDIIKPKGSRLFPKKEISKQTKKNISNVALNHDLQKNIIIHEQIKPETLDLETKPNKSSDPYADLIARITNNEFEHSEEQKIESLKAYLATTISGSSLENVAPIENQNSSETNPDLAESMELSE